MSSTTKTPNVNLSQFIGSDVPDWITDYTSDMKKIDDKFTEETENRLDTAEEIKANTTEKKAAGAKGVKALFDELNESLKANTASIYDENVSATTDFSVSLSGANTLYIITAECGTVDRCATYLCVRHNSGEFILVPLYIGNDVATCFSVSISGVVVNVSVLANYPVRYKCIKVL